MNKPDAAEFLQIAKRLSGVPGFPRGERLTATVAECATILEDSCQDATQANELVSRFTPRRWPGTPAFRQYVEKGNPTAELRQLAELGAANRPTEPGRAVEHYPGFEFPAWVFPPGASDIEIGRNVMKFSDELHATARTIVHKDLDRRQRKAILGIADRGAAVDVPPDKKLDYQDRFAAAREFRASLIMIEIQGWAIRDGVDWKAFFWHYIDVQKWFSEDGEPGRRRPFPQRETTSTK